jgi:hypothetical protein
MHFWMHCNEKLYKTCTRALERAPQLLRYSSPPLDARSRRPTFTSILSERSNTHS